MKSISVCMIVRDEEAVLERCLNGVRKIADEIIIVDTGSVDRTKEIAQKYTENVYDFPWEDDFAKARNVSFSYATCDYQMWLDADDVITDENAERINALKASLADDVDVVRMRYEFSPDDPLGSFRMRERLVKRERQFQFRNSIHETIPISDDANVLLCPEIFIEHRKEKELREYIPLLRAIENPTPRDKDYLCANLFAAEQYEEAETLFWDLYRAPEAYVNMSYPQAANYLLKEARYDELIEISNHLMEQEGVIPFFYTTISRCYLCKRDYKKAIEYAEKTLQLKPDFNSPFLHARKYEKFIPYLLLCKAYYRLHEEETAFAYIQKAVELNPRDVEAQSLKFRLLLALNSKK